jgi:hypothetical protein
MRLSARRAFALAFVGALFTAMVAPSADAGARPRPELTGCKGDCKKSEKKCGGGCIKTHGGCVTQCGCAGGRRCTEAQKNCLGLCNVRLDACVGGCRTGFTRCASKC